MINLKNIELQKVKGMEICSIGCGGEYLELFFENDSLRIYNKDFFGE